LPWLLFLATHVAANICGNVWETRSVSPPTPAVLCADGGRAGVGTAQRFASQTRPAVPGCAAVAEYNTEDRVETNLKRRNQMNDSSMSWENLLEELKRDLFSIYYYRHMFFELFGKGQERIDVLMQFDKEIAFTLYNLCYEKIVLEISKLLDKYQMKG
jgi:hypothetical protein